MAKDNWLEKVLKLPETDRFALWQYFRRRADEIRDRMWTVGTWIIALTGGLLALSLQWKVIALTDTFPGFAVMSPLTALFIGFVGIGLCFFLFKVLDDHVQHLTGNWSSADYVAGSAGKNGAPPPEMDSSRPARHLPRGAASSAKYALQTIASLFGVAFVAILVAAFVALIGVCEEKPAAAGAGTTHHVTLLSINDVYRIEGVDRGQRGGLARVRALRKQLEAEDKDLIVLHAGDAIYPSLMSKMYDGKQMIDVLNLLDGSEEFDKRLFVTFGNHEFDKGERKDVSIIADRVKESGFSWLRSNIFFATNDAGKPLVSGSKFKERALITANGVKVGIFSLTTDITKPDYVVNFEKPVDAARRLSAELRHEDAEVVIALTHLPVEKDAEVLKNLGPEGPDLIIGGHEHTRQKENIQGRWILKADSDAVSALVVRITMKPGASPFVQASFVPLAGDSPAPDEYVHEKVAQWRKRHDAEFCAKEKKPAGCLEVSVGKTAVTLIAEEEQIRSCETNFGNWLADQMRLAFPEADAAIVNAGGFRLNQNLPPGPIVERDIEELIQFDNDIRLIEIQPETLKDVVKHAVAGWPGNGHWLHISGITFRHDMSDPKSHKADHLALIDRDGNRVDLPSDRPIKVVTSRFLIDPDLGDQDGYTMLKPEMVRKVHAETLKDRIRKALKEAGPDGIRPKQENRIEQTENRICNHESQKK